jgi:ABC-type multidrug transport system ATPase subunit
VSVSSSPANSSAAGLSPGAPGAAVALSHLSKIFGRFAALRDVSAEFAAGKLYAVLGDNGAGKTTLLRCMVGLAPPSRGAVTVLGREGARAATAEIGYMAHPTLLYEEMSGMENLRYFAALYGIRDHQPCEQAIRSVGLDPALARRVGQYSQGMRQRLSLARAVVHDPKILFLDEPFSNVDVVSAREMVNVLAKMRDAGKTIFIVTHQASLLEGAADEFVSMAAGQINARTRDLPAGLQQGAPPARTTL